jgi:hypothetical protein
MSILTLAFVHAAFAATCPGPLHIPAEGAITVQQDRAGLHISLAGLESEGQASALVPWSSACPLEIVLEGLELHGIDPDEIDYTSTMQIEVAEEQLELPLQVQVVTGRQKKLLPATLTWSPGSVQVEPGGTEAETVHLYLKVSGPALQLVVNGSTVIPSTTTGLLLPAVQKLR